ncbi:unnamed protein product [Prunus armeniaca]
MANTNDASATPTTTSPTPSSMNTLTPSMVGVVSIKLDRTNYSLWLAQFLPILRSRDLVGFVDGFHECPPKHLSGSTTVNPAYTTWIQYDQLILSWINNSLSQSVLYIVSRNQTSRSTWLVLERRYASTSQNKILHLRNELMHHERRLVLDDELVQIIMNNLGPAYEMVVSAAQARDTPITYPTLEGTGRGGVPSNRGTVPNSRGNATRGSFTNQRSYQQVGEASSMNTRLVCQICGKPGHPALDCYQRMNLAYEGRIPAKGANAHVTHELQNLVNPKEYTGNDNVGGVGSQDIEDAFPIKM